ncbi:type IV toxin-antitoxin system AbiEi family antitoxin domain-containing protein [uncultured Jatrophihabitans sp.]|uniref:type IV toxin-antitoxin system AbiEi family antitoxin domain-containing protein n=1 Tax=uncultured Jatrophihabitans sp. TaxID=1610747 RepID=UPI0035C97E76
MRGIPPEAARQHGVFIAAQAHRAGWTRHALAHAVDYGYLERIRPGVFALPLEASGDDHAMAAARLRRASVAVGLTHCRMTLSHRGAAVLQDLPLLQGTSVPCVTFPRLFRGEVRGAHLHRARLFPGHVVRLGCVLLTSAGRTVVDLGRELGADDCVVAADAALRSGLTTADLLDEVLTRCAGWPGIRQAAHAVVHADPRAESALESVSRLRMVDAGLPTSWPQAIIRIGGRFVGRVDFYWDEFGVVGESDGLAKYDGKPLSLGEEKRRQGAMEDAGLTFVRWGWTELYGFDPVIRRLRAAFVRGLRPDRAPRLWTATPSLSPRPTGQLITGTGRTG